MMDPISRLYLRAVGGEGRRRFIRFCIVGASGVVVNLLFVELGHSVLFASFEPSFRKAFSFLLGIVLATFSNFVLDDIWTWRDRDKEKTTFLGRMIRFYLVSSVGCGLQWFTAMSLSTFWFSIHYQLAQLAGIVLATGFNFLANNAWTFRDQS